jgi:hypothetical protein
MPHFTSSRRTRAAELLLATVAALLLPARTARADASEDKANLVASFLKDVSIPGSALARTKGQPTFVVLGEDELAIALTASISAIDIGGKPVFVKFVRRPADVAGAQVVFVAASAYPQLAEVLAASAGGAITISDNAGFIGAGGMVSFGAGKLAIARVKIEAAGFKLGAKALAAAQ